MQKIGQKSNLRVYNLKSKSGITLIALVITIIVLLILAGVSISIVVGENGILVQSTTAVNETRKATAREEVQMAWISAESEHLGEWTKNTSTIKADFFTIENLNKYLAGTGEVTELDYVENGTSTVKYLRYEENLEYNVEIYNTGKSVVVGEPTEPVALYDLASEAKIGNKVAYDAGGGIFNWSDYSYDSSYFASPTVGTQHNFEASAYTGGWLVSNIEDGYVYLISERSVGTLYLKGKTAYNSYSNILNDICSIYANSKFTEVAQAPKNSDLNDNIRSFLTESFWINEQKENEYATSNYYTFLYYVAINNYINYADGNGWFTINQEYTGGAWGENDNDISSGMHPIIKLKYGIKTTGKNDAGEWVLY